MYQAMKGKLWKTFPEGEFESWNERFAHVCLAGNTVAELKTEHQLLMSGLGDLHLRDVYVLKSVLFSRS